MPRKRINFKKMYLTADPFDESARSEDDPDEMVELWDCRACDKTPLRGLVIMHQMGLSAVPYYFCPECGLILAERNYLHVGLILSSRSRTLKRQLFKKSDGEKAESVRQQLRAWVKEDRAKT